MWHFIFKNQEINIITVFYRVFLDQYWHRQKAKNMSITTEKNSCSEKESIWNKKSSGAFGSKAFGNWYIYPEDVCDYAE